MLHCFERKAFKRGLIQVPDKAWLERKKKEATK